MKYPRALITSPDIYPDSVDRLNSMGTEVLFSCKNENVMPPLGHHSDMQITPVSFDTYVAAPECFDYYTNLLKKFDVNIIRGNTYLSCNYPLDIAYNIIVTENYAMHNFRHTDIVIKNYLKTKKLINLSQGYTACTLCVLTEQAYITSDPGIAVTLDSLGFDVLVINDESILLPGFDHGFFGGSTVMLSDNLLAVNGNVKLHNDFGKISAFCHKHGIDLLSLSDNLIMDIGSLIRVL